MTDRHDDDVETVTRERDRLRAWKKEALPLFDGLQDLGRALDLPLGTLVTGPRAIEAAEALRAERDAARAVLARAARLADEWEAVAREQRPHLGCLDMHNHLAAELRAVLSAGLGREVAL